MLDPEMIHTIKRVQIRARYLVNDLFAGEYKSAFRGRGMEFEEVRPYLTGDDTRSIDWNITARFGSPFVKTYREERELTVMLIVDVSSSGHFGTIRRRKQDLATELAATLAYAAVQNNDKVGLILFSDKVECYIPPRKGAAHIWKVIREILSCGIRHRKTDIAVSLNYLMKVCRRRAICFIISDFIDKDFEEALSIAARKHELIGLVISDEREEHIPPLGLMAFQDAETGEIVWVNSKKTAFQKAFTRHVRRTRKTLISKLRTSRVDVVRFATGQPIIYPLMQYFRMRDRRSVGL